tara:strand:- start:295 stop:453 length:159 start_codon:yes stop_codon:yes gene_type:complete
MIKIKDESVDNPNDIGYLRASNYFLREENKKLKDKLSNVSKSLHDSYLFTRK